MRQDLKVSSSITINAAPQKVWEALTNPTIIKEYLYGTETITDWKVGSNIIFQGEYQGHQYRDKGIVLQNKPLSLLSYSYWTGFSGLEDKPENYATVTYTVKSKDNNKTKFTWKQQGYANEQGYLHSKNGMKAFLKSIKKIIER
jgi:uncharacterized protein YndB with AHSA1/START domain